MAKDASNTKIPFMKAYSFLLKRKDLTPAEKLVLVVICRYWPNPYWASNNTIASDLGFSERYIEKVVRNLASKRIIKRGYAHKIINGKPYTRRVIAPTCFPKVAGYKVKWIKPEHMDGLRTEQKDGDRPNNSSFLPEQSDDLLEMNREDNRNATPSPLPASGQAPALLEDREHEQKESIEQFKGNLGRGRKSPPLSAEEKQRRVQEQVMALKAIEK